MKTTARLLAPVLLAAAHLLLSSCVTAHEDDVFATAAPKDDEDYAPAFAKATQSRTLFKDFENRYSVTATYLSPEFRTAFARRLARVYKAERPPFEEASQKAAFFVSITSPSPDKIDLTNPNHWTVLLGGGGETAMKPVLVKRVDDKERWRAFFDTVNHWTTEYLIVFDAPSVDPKSPALVEKVGLNLTFANADGAIALAW